MPALQVAIDAFLTAAELFALLFVSPVSATEQPIPARTVSAPAYERARELHLVSTSFDVRLLGSLADIRLTQEFRNRSATTINLSGYLPAVDEYTDALRIHRRGRTIDLMQLGSGCGGEESDDEDLQADIGGNVQLAVDESIADALQLAPGETASIELIATQSLSRSPGAAYRLALPALAGVESQALLVDQGDTQFVVIVAHRLASATARLTLRPYGAASEIIELGVLTQPVVAHIIPLASREALQALASGAIEIETRTQDGIVWSTLPTQLRTDSSLALAATAK
ncbi:MAG TPA: hypothetical protein VE421_01080 [Burkholderiaceae bacterium]|nr:hypothetical protein [Burkholderiaceae bacterium]